VRGAIKSNANPGTARISDTAAWTFAQLFEYLIPAEGGCRDRPSHRGPRAHGNLHGARASPDPGCHHNLVQSELQRSRVPDILGYPLAKKFPSWEVFGLSDSLCCWIVTFLYLGARTVHVSPPNRSSEFAPACRCLLRAYLVLIAVMFFIELQPFFLEGMFEYIDDVRSPEGEAKGLTTLVTILTPLAAIVTLFRNIWQPS